MYKNLFIYFNFNNTINFSYKYKYNENFKTHSIYVSVTSIYKIKKLYLHNLL